MARSPLIIDCDPGVDDAIALFMAFAAPEMFDIVAITTVSGNVDAALTARNACLIRQLAQREDVPVYAGAAAPLVRAPIAASHFHGVSGLGDLNIFAPSAPVAPGVAADVIVEQVMRRAPGTVSLAVTGPMTNLALALRREPALVSHLGPVVAMGGARSAGGNITASAEFNIFADPHAAHEVLTSGLRVTLLGLDATHQVRATPQRVAVVKGIDTVGGRTVAQLLDFCVRTQNPLAGCDGPPLHDPCVIAYLLAPHLFRAAPVDLRIETQSSLTMGHTAVEFRLPDPTAANAIWVTEADADGVFALLLDLLGRG